MTGLWRIAFVVLALGAAISAWSYPTLTGETGMILAPTADVMPTAHFDLAVNYARVNDGATKPVEYPVRFVYGLTNSTEASLASVRFNGSGAPGIDYIGAGLKVSVLQENLETNYPGIAFGARAAKMSRVGFRDVRISEGYLAVSKSLFANSNFPDSGFVIRLHGGATYTNYSGGWSGSFVTPFAGVTYKSANDYSAAVDFVGRQVDNTGKTFREDIVSAVIRYPITSEFGFELGTTRPFGMGKSNTLYAGIKYHYGERLDRGRDFPVLF